MKTYTGNSNLDYIINLKEEYLEYIFTTEKGKNSYNLSYKDYYLKKVIHKSLFSKRYYLNVYKNGSSDVYLSLPLFKNESQINEILVYSNKRRSILNKYFKEEQLKKIEKQKNQLNRRKLIELKKEEIKNKKILSFVEELDVDGNGVIDVSENNDFSKLLKSKQKLIIEFEKSEGKNYIQNFIKLSKYLKDKSGNIQSLFEIIREGSNLPNYKYDEYVGVLKNQINTYNLMLLSSLNMIITLTEDDRITFYEIYETFDKLNVFTSNHEREMSMRLKNIESKLDEVVQSIYQMEMNICSELYNLQFITEDMSDSLSGLSQGLSEINSSIQTNNLLTGIQTYQMYKINQNTKSLRG